jgi:hypothetical protein
MHFEFEITDLGELSYFLGMESMIVKEGMVMHQQKYMCELLDRFDMTDCNTITYPSETNARHDEFS